MARRAPSSLVWLLFAGGAACLPEERPLSLVDHTDVLFVQGEVAERGPFGSDPPAGGGRVTEVVPGDRVRVSPFVAGPEGLVDPDVLDPRWYACRKAPCLITSLDDALACPDPVPMPPELPCELGRGGAIEFVLGPITDVEALLVQGLTIVMVAGTPEGPDSDACVRRLGNIERESASLRDCVIYVHALEPGPLWRLAWLLSLDPSLPWLPVELTDLPATLPSYEPDTSPELDGFIAWVPVEGGGQKFVELPPGGALTVRAGDVIDLEVVSASQPQRYPLVQYGLGEVYVEDRFESRWAKWYATDPSPFVLDVIPGRASWQAPLDPGRVDIYVVYGDERSVEGGWLRVEVEGR